MTSTTSKPIEATPAARANRGPPDRRYGAVKLSVDPTLKPWRSDDEVIEEFPFDDELTRQFFRDKLACEACVECWTWNLFMGCWAAPCILCRWGNADANAADLAYSRWVAVSKENIYIVRRKRKSDMRQSCCDVPEMRKTIPINNVQDIMITEPAAYAVCDCCVPNVLTSVKVETAGNSGDGGIGDASVGLLSGMEDPQRFRTVVLNLKKGVYVQPSGEATTVAAPPAVDSLGRTLGTPGLPAIGASVACCSSQGGVDALSAAAAASGSKVEALLGSMLTTLQSIDQRLSYAKVTTSDAAAR